MIIITIYRLSEKEIKELPIQALVEYSSSNFKSLTQRVKREEFFTKEELERLPSIIAKAKQVYYNPRKTMDVKPDEYKMWGRVGEFLSKHWCK